MLLIGVIPIFDREVEEAMVSVILKSLFTHAVFGEENGWRCVEKSADYAWVLDPIDGTKNFITGKPLFGMLIALLHNGKLLVLMTFFWLMLRRDTSAHPPGAVKGIDSMGYCKMCSICFLWHICQNRTESQVLAKR